MRTVPSTPVTFHVPAPWPMYARTFPGGVNPFPLSRNVANPVIDPAKLAVTEAVGTGTELESTTRTFAHRYRSARAPAATLIAGTDPISGGPSNVTPYRYAFDVP